MKTFKYPLAIEGSKEEIDALIPKLKELGYEKHDSNTLYFENDYLVTNFANKNGKFGYTRALTEERTLVSASNPELVLALAACVDHDYKCSLGEWVIANGSCIGEDGSFHKISEVDESGTMFNVHGYTKSMGTQYTTTTSFVLKPTKEQLIEHFTKSMVMEKKIVAYKLVKTYPNSMELGTLIKSHAYAFENICPKYPEFWQPVYEEKPKFEKVTLRCDGGTFEVIVSEKGIYSAPEKVYLNIDQLKKALEGIIVDTNNNDRFLFKPTYINSGCKRNVPVEDWNVVISKYIKYVSES